MGGKPTARRLLRDPSYPGYAEPGFSGCGMRSFVPPVGGVEINRAAAAARLALVADHSQKSVTLPCILFRFDTLRREAVDHAEDSPALLCFGDDHFHRIRRRA